MQAACSRCHRSDGRNAWHGPHKHSSSAASLRMHQSPPSPGPQDTSRGMYSDLGEPRPNVPCEVGARICLGATQVTWRMSHLAELPAGVLLRALKSLSRVQTSTSAFVWCAVWSLVLHGWARDPVMTHVYGVTFPR